MAIPLLQLRLGIEEIHLAGRPLHEQEDDVLCPWFEMRRSRRERVGCSVTIGLQQLCQRHRAQANGCTAKEIAAGPSIVHHYSLTINSSRFRSTLATLAQAARSPN